MAEFLLVRHCLTDWNVAGRTQGRTDIPLNAEGRAQARVLAETLTTLLAPPLRLGGIVSSPLARARETAAIIAAFFGIVPIVDGRLAECGFGSLEGLTQAEIEERLGGPMPDHDEPYDFRPFGGEDRETVIARHVAALGDHAGSGARILLVGHGRGFNTLLAHLDEPTLRERGDFRELTYP